MDPKRQESDLLESEIPRLEQSINAECVEIGRRIATQNGKGSKNEELHKYLNSIRTLLQAVDSARSDIDRIRTLTRDVEEGHQEIEENRQNRDRLLAERASRFGDLGIGAFASFKSNPG